MAQIETAPKWVTAEELLAMPDDGLRRELVAGEVVVMAPAGYRHGQLAAKVLHGLLRAEEQGLGVAFGAETGFLLAHNPDNARAPYAAFIVAVKAPEHEPDGFSTIVPGLVLEVVSPHDREAEVLEKAGMWLDAGVRVGWVLWPSTRRVTIFRSGDDISVLGETDSLTCEELLPGFALPLGSVCGKWG